MNRHNARFQIHIPYTILDSRNKQLLVLRRFPHSINIIRAGFIDMRQLAKLLTLIRHHAQTVKVACIVFVRLQWNRLRIRNQKSCIFIQLGSVNIRDLLYSQQDKLLVKRDLFYMKDFLFSPVKTGVTR